jgi:hypothetical protein
MMQLARAVRGVLSLDLAHQDVPELPEEGLSSLLWRAPVQSEPKPTVSRIQMWRRPRSKHRRQSILMAWVGTADARAKDGEIGEVGGAAAFGEPASARGCIFSSASRTDDEELTVRGAVLC